MVDSQGMLLGGDVVAQYQVKFEILPPLPGYGGDGVVGLSIRVGVNKCVFIRILPPFLQNPVCQGDDPVAVLTV